jgi:diacylglycerol kinase (ATP)
MSPGPRQAIIFNPFARGEKAGRLEEEIRQLAPADAEFLPTRMKGDATRLAREAARQGLPAVIAAGGDGTLNEVLNGLMQAREKDGVAELPALGVLPAGTVNVFAQEISLPLNLAGAWDVIAAGQTRVIDVGRANDHYFAQMAGVGLDAQVVRDTDPGTRKNFGPLSYLFTAAGVLGQAPPDLIVETPGKRPVHGAFVLVGNGRYYGGPFELFKKARLDNGKLEVLVFQNLGYPDIFRYLQHIALGRHDELPDVRTLSVRECVVRSALDGAGPAAEAEAPAPETSVPAELDGEFAGGTPVRFLVVPQAIRVFVP